MNRKPYRDILDSAAADSLSRNTNLMPNISAQLERKPLMMTLRTHPIVALLIVFLILFALSGVVYALGRAFGYIPGVGLVDQSLPIRVLKAPIKIKQGELTITVLKVVADASQTFVAYRVKGIPPPTIGGLPTCGESPRMRLPNGTELKVLNDRNSGGMGSEDGLPMNYQAEISYAPVPADIEDIVLVFPCILPIGKGPENWQIPIHLSPAPQNFATPAFEIGATFVASNPEFATTPTPIFSMTFTPEAIHPSNLDTPTLSPNASGLYLEKVIELPDSYILVGNFTDAGNLPGPLVINLDPYEDLPHMEDGAGNPVPFKVREDIQPENMLGGVRYWAYEIQKPVRGPVTITLDQVNIAVSDRTQFHFDAGTDPRVGQKWELNLPIHLRSYDYVIDSVEAIQDGYLFKYHSGLDAEPVSLLINIVGSSPLQDHGSLIHQETVVEYSESFTYPAPLPTGQLTVELSLTESVPLQGPWSLVWTPSATKP